jgi:hypothetical protein
LAQPARIVLRKYVRQDEALPIPLARLFSPSLTSTGDLSNLIPNGINILSLAFRAILRGRVSHDRARKLKLGNGIRRHKGVKHDHCHH